MSTPLEIMVEGFRTFRDKTHVSVAPLTLFYGRNQSGKSSLLRLFPFIGDSLQPETPLLDMDSPALMGSTFKELGWLGKNPKKPKITLQSGNRFYFVDLDADFKPFANRLKIGNTENENHCFSVSLDDESPEFLNNRNSAQYAGKKNNDDWRGQLTFTDFFVQHENLPEPEKGIVQKLRKAFLPFHRIQWFHANRLTEWNAEWDKRAIRCCSRTGSDLPDRLTGKKEILNNASEWLNRTIQEELEIQSDSQGKKRFQLRKTGLEARGVHLAGEGVRSLLPILLSACWAEIKQEDSPTMLAIEEPESHLHPTIQIELFNRLLETVKAGIPVILETHSIYILRALQLAILEGKITSEEVRLYWFEQDNEGAAFLETIQIGDDAIFRNWRPGVFEEEQNLSRKIVDKRWDLSKEKDTRGK